MGRHLWTSLLYLHELRLRTFYHLWTNYYYYPPFRYWTTLPFYLAFGTSLKVAVLSNIVFIALLVFSMYGIGRELWDRTTGLLSALFISALPLIASQFKEYQLDSELTAMVAWSLYALIRTREFSNRRDSLWFGLTFGLGMLTKWTFFNCMALPLAYGIGIPESRRLQPPPLRWGGSDRDDDRSEAACNNRMSAGNCAWR